MEFLKPAWLWGLCTLVLPVIIHFWYQKRGETIWWATNQWLSEKTSLKHRGVRLDDIPLMLIRCLLLFLLAAILSQPILHFLSTNTKSKRVHLVENNASLMENFRFEIETAIKKGEKVYLTGPETEELKSFEITNNETDSGIYLQKNVQNVSNEGSELHLYLSNSNSISIIPKIYVLGGYQLHYVPINEKNNSVNYLSVGNGKGLFVDQSIGLLTNADIKDIEKRYKKADQVHSGDYKVRLDVNDIESRKSIESALRALETVYELPIKISTAKYSQDTIFDLVITDTKLGRYFPQTLYIIIGAGENFEPNIIFLNDSLHVSNSELVRSGRLPEWLGEQIVNHYHLENKTIHLSYNQLSAKFETVISNEFQTGSFSKWLIVGFLLTLLVERGIVFRKEWRNG